ncbi:putative transcription factor bHLH107 [Mercurialis annua]|uniref:putative transcription factor bHLH107 n=1 Tax=Mercurialis annua TaxID=3986 RepID=UPI00215DE247|nr:putative transcription factor bHLH107 [Mercurialis annua]
MLPFQTYHITNHHNGQFLTEPCLVNVMDGGASTITTSSEKKSTELDQPCSSSSTKTTHKEAERRRRQRINNHLSTLRTLLPNSAAKTDKASLLAEVVRHVKELRNKATAALVAGGTEKYSMFPGELDEASLSYCEGDDELAMKTMRVSVCCDDRPGLNRDLSQAIKSVRARAVQAEMMTIGGRTKSVVVVKWGNGGGGGEEDFGVLRRALRSVVDNRVAGPGLGQVALSNKRVRGYGWAGGDGYDEF